jgi:hypothetical protein
MDYHRRYNRYLVGFYPGRTGAGLAGSIWSELSAVTSGWVLLNIQILADAE